MRGSSSSSKIGEILRKQATVQIRDGRKRDMTKEHTMTINDGHGRQISVTKVKVSTVTIYDLLKLHSTDTSTFASIQLIQVRTTVYLELIE